MRLGSWFGGILIAVAVATSVGAVTLARQHTSAAPALTASRQAAAGTSFSAYDPGPDPPHKIDPPSPVEVAAPPNPAAGEPPAARPPASQPSIAVNSTPQALVHQDRAAPGLSPLAW